MFFNLSAHATILPLVMILCAMLAQDVEFTAKRVGGLIFVTCGKFSGSFYVSKLTKRPSLKKIGGIHHWRFLTIGGSFHRRRTVTKARIALALRQA